MNFEEILFDLDSPLEETRKNAIMLLVKKSDSQALPYLKKIAAGDESPGLRFLAQQGIFQIEPKLTPAKKTVEYLSDEKIRIFIESGTDDEKLKALDSLAEHLNLEFYPLIKKQLKTERSEKLICRLLHVLSRFSIQSDVQFYRQFVKHPSKAVKRQIIEILGGFASREAYEILILFLIDDEESLHQPVLNFLKFFGQTHVLELLEGMIKHRDPELVEAAVVTAGYFGESSLPLLELALKSLDPKTKEKAAEVLKSLSSLNITGASSVLKKQNLQSDNHDSLSSTFDFKTSEISGYLQNFLKTKRYEKNLINTEAVDTEKILKMLKPGRPEENIRGINLIISQRKYKLFENVLELLKSSENAMVKGQCLRAVAKLGGEQFLSVISRGLKSRFPEVKKGAIAAVKILNTKDTIQLLVPLLDDATPSVRGTAILALRDYPAINAHKIIENMLDSPSDDMKLEAFYVLANLGDGKTATLLDKLRSSRKPLISQKAEKTLQIMAGNGNIFARTVLEGKNIGNFHPGNA